MKWHVFIMKNHTTTVTLPPRSDEAATGRVVLIGSGTHTRVELLCNIEVGRGGGLRQRFISGCLQSHDTHVAQTSDGRAGGEIASVKRRHSVYSNSVEQKNIHIGIDLYFLDKKKLLGGTSTAKDQ